MTLQFWKEITYWLFDLFKKRICFSAKDVICFYENNGPDHTTICLVNFIILLDKYIIHKSIHYFLASLGIVKCLMSIKL